MADYAVIGGTGVEYLTFKNLAVITADTPYGSAVLEKVILEDQEVIFLKRHGDKHRIPPHLINYRANIWALKQLGVKKIVATGAVGSISPDLKVGQLVLPDQFLDFTKTRKQTFFEGEEAGVLHVDVSDPYCRDLRDFICRVGKQENINVYNGGVYVCTEGPRFETPAEINMFKILGGEMVGMTGVPEVVLARELGMCYATIALVTNEAAGLNNKPLTHAEVIDTMKLLGNRTALLLKKLFANIVPQQECYCSTGSKELGKF